MRARQPKTIAHVLTSLHIGGAERVALLLARHQNSLGHRVLVVSLEEMPDGALEEDFARAGAEVLKTPKAPGFDWTLPPRLYRLFLRERAAIVHTHNPLPLIYAAPAARCARARVVHTKHGAHADKALRIWLRRFGALSVHAFVAVSEPTAEFARELGEVPLGKLHVVDNAVDVDRFVHDGHARAELRAQWGLPADSWVIGTVGRMAPEKNHRLLVRACAPLLGQGVRLVIIGDGALRSEVEAEVEEHGVGRWVALLGARTDVERALSALDVFALSSNTEGLPLSLIEAMAASLPVVATEVGGIVGVVAQEETGLLAPARDEHALRAALARLGGDRPLAARLGDAGRRVAEERFGVERMHTAYARLYEGLPP